MNQIPVTDKSTRRSQSMSSSMKDKDSDNGFQSRFGFLLVSAGCAIGIGNVWKFPYIAGQNGGGIFVFLYILFLVLMGIPVLAMELSLGRASRKSAVPAYKALEPAGSKWHIHGWLCIAGSYILMMYYTTVAGWMLSYFIKYVTGVFSEPDVDVDEVYQSLLASPGEMMFYTSIIVVLGFLVTSFSIRSGLERVTKFMMIGLLGIILILVVNSFLLKGAGEGFRFFLSPNMDKVAEHGGGNVVVAAMNQAFFTLSVGMGAMEIFGSYMSRKKSLLHEAGTICIMDTFVAICSGLIIFPACFTFSVEPTEGPSLIFSTLPRVFNNMAGGRVWGIFFFLFMTFASFSTVIAVFEGLIKHSEDNFGVSRRKAAVINCLIMLAASVPCVLGFNRWSEVRLMGDRNILSGEDFMVSNLILPIGALIYTVFCSYKFGWGFEKFAAEANEGEGFKVRTWMKPYFRYVLPVLMLVVIVQGLV